MERRAVERRCADALKGLKILRPLDVADLARQVSERRGKPLLLVPKAVTDGPPGLTVSMLGRDVVFYEASTSPAHAEHIILHELGHLLCGHVLNERLSPDVVAALLPAVDPRLIQHVMGRTGYTDPEEQEAELMASLIVQRAQGGHTAVVDARESSAVIDRFTDAIGA